MIYKSLFVCSHQLQIIKGKFSATACHKRKKEGKDKGKRKEKWKGEGKGEEKEEEKGATENTSSVATPLIMLWLLLGVKMTTYMSVALQLLNNN